MIHFSSSFFQWLIEQKHQGSVLARLVVNANNLHDEFWSYKLMITDKEINYITMRGDGMLSYLPAGKEHKVTPEGQWAREGRQSGKPAKVIRKIFTEKALRFIKPNAFELFGNAYKAKFVDNGYKFELRPNTSICDVYDMPRGAGESSLSTSCMNGDTDYLAIYESCKFVQILTLTNKHDQLCGRALVWQVEHKGAMITFMDRIYVVEDYMYDLFIAHALENEWWRKRDYKSFENKLTWINPETQSAETVNVTINTPTDFNAYPYIDTFAYGGDGWLSNSSSGDYTYNETNGTRDGDGSNEEDEHENDSYDEINDEYISCDDAVYTSERGERRYRSRTTHIDSVRSVRVSGRDTEYFHRDDENITSINGRWYWTSNDDVVCKHDGDFALLDDCVQCETDNEWYENDDSDLLQAQNGCWYHKQDDAEVIYVQGNGEQDIRGEYLYLPDHEGEVNKATDGNWYYTHDNRVTQVVDDEDSAWFVIAHDAPRMILQVDGQWHHRADVADVTVYHCNDKGERWTTIEHFLQKDERVVFVESIIGPDAHKELGWYRKEDLLTYRRKYYRKDDQRMLVRLLKSVTPSKRKRAIA